MMCSMVFCRMYFIVFVYLFLTTVECCTPPDIKYGEYSIKKSSVVQRAVKSKIAFIGSVVEFYEDRFRHPSTAKIAVHIKLKGNEDLPKFINVSGFGKTHQNADCTDTLVELYGTYIIFVKKSRYGKYYVDHVGYKPAASELTCVEKHMVKRSRRILKKFRKLRNTDVQCNDIMKNKQIKSRKCLKLKVLISYLNEFKYNGIRTRHVYCTLKKILYNSTGNKRTGNELMRDDVVSTWKKQPQNNGRTLWEQKKWYKDLGNRDNVNTKIIVYSNEKNYIFPQSKTHEANIPTKWRLFEKYTNKITSSAKTIYLSTILSLTCLLFQYNL